MSDFFLLNDAFENMVVNGVVDGRSSRQDWRLCGSVSESRRPGAGLLFFYGKVALTITLNQGARARGVRACICISGPWKVYST
jgi:hypothetical protein